MGPRHRSAARPRLPHHYFTQHYGRGAGWYKAMFPVSGVCGDATPYYLFHPRAAERAADLSPRLRLIVLLRDPVERAFSHWQHNRRKAGREPLSFRDALSAEDERIGDDHDLLARGEIQRSHAHQHWSYRRRGYYADQIAVWLRHFPRDALLVLRSEELLTRPADVVWRAARHVGLPDRFPLRAVRGNVGGYVDSVPDDLAVELRAHFASRNAGLGALLEGSDEA